MKRRVIKSIFILLTLAVFSCPLIAASYNPYLPYKVGRYYEPEGDRAEAAGLNIISFSATPYSSGYMFYPYHGNWNGNERSDYGWEGSFSYRNILIPGFESAGFDMGFRLSFSNFRMTPDALDLFNKGNLWSVAALVTMDVAYRTYRVNAPSPAENWFLSFALGPAILISGGQVLFGGMVSLDAGIIFGITDGLGVSLSTGVSLIAPINKQEDGSWPLFFSWNAARVALEVRL